MIALAAVLLVTASRYGYHRDELYFRMLPPAWGYVDQPPLTPLLARTASALVDAGPVGLRLVSLVCAVASIPLLVAITREVSGGRLAQIWTAWGLAGATLTLQFGHVLLTASLDLVVWPATVLFVLRAIGREQGRWWLAAGAVAGLSSYNKLLIPVLLAGIALGLAAFGPRHWFRSGWLWGGLAVAAALSLPNLVYQATNGWPQLAMGAALQAENAAEVRVMMWPFLILLVGPFLAVWWVAGVVWLLRDRTARPYRFLVVVLVTVVTFVFLAGAQFYYTAGILAVLTAIGAVPVASWASSRGRRWAVVALTAVNAAGCAVTTLPLAPLPSRVASVLAGVNSTVADQVGWETYVGQIQAAVEASQAQAVITSNYGEAGALEALGDLDVEIHSGHNALWELGGPEDGTDVVVLVGAQAMDQHFTSCEPAGELANGVEVENEEEGVAILVCEGPREPWSQLWPQLRHLS